jgi:hypothetical protein
MMDHGAAPCSSISPWSTAIQSIASAVLNGEVDFMTGWMVLKKTDGFNLTGAGAIVHARVSTNPPAVEVG